MHFTSKCVIIFLICATLVSAPFCTALAQEQAFKENTGTSPGKMAADLLFVRPVGLLSIVTGSLIFVVALPFSAAGKNVGESAQNLVVAPTKYTFDRPLGNF